VRLDIKSSPNSSKNISWMGEYLGGGRIGFDLEALLQNGGFA
jgi:hypothetical protein